MIIDKNFHKIAIDIRSEARALESVLAEYLVEPEKGLFDKNGNKIELPYEYFYILQDEFGRPYISEVIDYSKIKEGDVLHHVGGCITVRFGGIEPTAYQYNPEPLIGLTIIKAAVNDALTEFSKYKKYMKNTHGYVSELETVIKDVIKPELLLSSSLGDSESIATVKDKVIDNLAQFLDLPHSIGRDSWDVFSSTIDKFTNRLVIERIGDYRVLEWEKMQHECGESEPSTNI